MSQSMSSQRSPPTFELIKLIISALYNQIMSGAKKTTAAYFLRVAVEGSWQLDVEAKSSYSQISLF
jgi:hypothetical protein